MEIFCFFVGILYVYTLNPYLLLAPLAFFYISRSYSIIILFILGLSSALIHHWLILPTGLPDVSVIPEASIQGIIASIPVQKPNQTQFLLALKQMDNHSAQGLVQLTWYNQHPPVHAGQYWQFSAKIKKPRNFFNPGSYDYVNSLVKHHIFWTGYIQTKNNKRLDNSTALPWLALRERLGNALATLAPDLQTAGVIEAVTLNLTRHISQKNWELFRRTGTTHLFGISGEHIALITGLFTLIIKWLWSRSAYLCLKIPAISVASSGSLIIAFLYAVLAGFEPPVQRALIGCCFYTLYCLGKQRVTPWQIWRYALFAVLLFEPHAVFMQGFYFSFLAVACLFLTQQRWSLTGYKKNLALQLSCLIGLMPLTLYWFSYGSFNGFIANLFAIPLVGLLIVPLALLAMLFSAFTASWILMKPLSWLIFLLFKGLVWTEQLAAINISWSIQSPALVLSLMAALLMWVLLPLKPFKYLTLLWLFIPLFPPRTTLHPGEALIQILDVGQGLAVSIKTQHHLLLYDTGDQFFTGNDLGNLVILPFYRATNVKKIDKIVISHPDKDHRGGLKSVEAGILVKQLLVNDLHYYDHGLNCHQYPAWQWDGVYFRFFPIQQTFNSKNNNSCILQIRTAKGRALLTGDIEKSAEEYLVKTYGNQLSSEVLLVPHHGSKTSSSLRFLLEVAPQYAIASLGFNNRFHFPHPKTLTSMRTLNIPFFRTDQCGMVEVLLPTQGSVKKPKCFHSDSSAKESGSM